MIWVLSTFLQEHFLICNFLIELVNQLLFLFLAYEQCWWKHLSPSICYCKGKTSFIYFFLYWTGSSVCFTVNVSSKQLVRMEMAVSSCFHWKVLPGCPDLALWKKNTKTIRSPLNTKMEWNVLKGCNESQSVYQFKTTSEADLLLRYWYWCSYNLLLTIVLWLLVVLVYSDYSLSCSLKKRQRKTKQSLQWYNTAVIINITW